MMKDKINQVKLDSRAEVIGEIARLYNLTPAEVEIKCRKQLAEWDKEFTNMATNAGLMTFGMMPNYEYLFNELKKVLNDGKSNRKRL